MASKGAAVNDKFWSFLERHRIITWILLILLTAVILVLSVRTKRAAPPAAELVGWVYLVATLSALLIVIAVGLVLASAGARLRDLLIGLDGRTSTSKVQYLLWTVGVAFGLLVVAFYSVLGTGQFRCNEGDNAPDRYCIPDSVWGEYLILLGVPAAAAVISKTVVTAKTADGTLQKDQASEARLADIGSNDANRADLIDIQYLVFNLIAFLYFAINFALKGTLVEIPSIILGLTSAAAATYTVNKALVTNRPIIKSVVPSTLFPGSTVSIRGQNLRIGESSRIRVKIGGQEAPAVESSQEPDGVDLVTCTAPATLPSGDAQVRVVTADSTETDDYPVVVAAPQILGWVGTAPRPGRRADLRVEGLPTVGEPEVVVGNLVIPAVRSGGNKTLTFQVPRTAAGRGKIDLSLRIAGVELTKATVSLTA